MESNHINSFVKNSFIYFKDDNVVMQFIPIVLALFYGFYTREFRIIAHTVLGKLFTVTLILYYTKINYLYGTIVCVLAIFYYRMTDSSIEGFAKMVDNKMLLLGDKCDNGVLMHKGIPVNPEMTSHIYPEIQFPNDKACNPCDKTCDFTIIETGRELAEPKNSRDFMSIVHNAIMGDEFTSDFKPHMPQIIG
jgi:hypothetical protein